MRVRAVLVVVVHVDGRGIDVGACRIGHHRSGLVGVCVGAVLVARDGQRDRDRRSRCPIHPKW